MTWNITREVTADDILKAVNRSLEHYPFSGKATDIHKNSYGEWIADCEIYEPNKVHRVQRMVEVYRFEEGDNYPWITLWPAKDNLREMTFGEESGIRNGEPDSPYILEYIERYRKEREKNPAVF